MSRNGSFWSCSQHSPKKEIGPLPNIHGLIQACWQWWRRFESCQGLTCHLAPEPKQIAPTKHCQMGRPLKTDQERLKTSYRIASKHLWRIYIKGKMLSYGSVVRGLYSSNGIASTTLKTCLRSEHETRSKEIHQALSCTILVLGPERSLAGCGRL